MGMVIGVVLVVVIFYFVLSGRKKASPPQRQAASPKPSPKKAIKPSEVETALATFNDNKGWLASRWAEANHQKEAGIKKDFPIWYFEEATERQTKLLAEKGISLPNGQLSKGQASDVIGLFFPVAESDEQVLKFFKIPAKGLNQTTAQIEVNKLLAEPENATAWRQRSADVMQKEFYRFFGIKIPTDLTHATANAFIRQHQKVLDSQQLDDWSTYESILDELSDKETCECYDIKKPTMATVRDAVAALRASGKALSDLEDNLDSIAQKIIEMNPALKL
jgi:hypothetical protein